ncbi:MAG: hypothetical protein JWM98_2307 [Thermoleophilia bacterium]|nr:hypothetical protein [Thermoleophilia bacterium]
MGEQSTSPDDPVLLDVELCPVVGIDVWLRLRAEHRDAHERAGVAREARQSGSDKHPRESQQGTQGVPPLVRADEKADATHRNDRQPHLDRTSEVRRSICGVGPRFEHGSDAVA